jgi:hypothetical protein
VRKHFYIKEFFMANEMAEKFITTTIDQSEEFLDEIIKIKEVLKPLGFSIRAYNKKSRTSKIIIERTNAYVKL